MIGKGDEAPKFTLPDGDGTPFVLADALGAGPIVLFFYPGDFTPICTAESCSFRDSHQDFVTAGARVVGVSGDGVERHRDFAAAHGLPYTLLSDEDGAVRKLYGATTMFGMVPGRVTFVIDGDGVVQHVFSSQLASERHVQEALAVVRRLAETKTGEQRQKV